MNGRWRICVSVFGFGSVRGIFQSSLSMPFSLPLRKYPLNNLRLCFSTRQDIQRKTAPFWYPCSVGQTSIRCMDLKEAISHPLSFSNVPAYPAHQGRTSEMSYHLVSWTYHVCIGRCTVVKCWSRLPLLWFQPALWNFGATSQRMPPLFSLHRKQRRSGSSFSHEVVLLFVP